jgi:hypothetical protein
MALKRFHKSHALVFQFNQIETETLKQNFPYLHRDLVLVGAAPGVTAEDIVAEVVRIEEDLERGGYLRPLDAIENPLFTTATETDEFIVVLIYKAFVKVATSPDIWKGKTRRERYLALAGDLIRTRDKCVKGVFRSDS